MYVCSDSWAFDKLDYKHETEGIPEVDILFQSDWSGYHHPSIWMSEDGQSWRGIRASSQSQWIGNVILGFCLHLEISAMQSPPNFKISNSICKGVKHFMTQSLLA